MASIQTKTYYPIILALLVFFTLLGKPGNAYAQNFEISGIVKDSVTRSPLEMALIMIPDLNYWATSDIRGEFVIKNIPAGNYTISFHILGYKDVHYTLSITSDIPRMVVPMPPQSLALKEVTVTATESKFGTSSVINNEAIQHIQPKSLTDIFQLLPGQITENPSLADPGQVKIRDASGNTNTALGTLILMDGFTVTNDANMQVFSTAKSGGATATPGTLGGGADLRDISAENIESVEVIRGIPSSEYGNLTSGVALVKTKMGETPWVVNVKTDPNTKIGSLEKGFRLPGNNGIVNAGIDLAQAYDDIRLKYKGYRRITGNMGYSNTYWKKTTPLTFHLKFSYYHTIDENKTDPELKTGEIIRSGKNGFRVGLNGKWMLKKSWITNLEYSFSGDYAHIEDYKKDLLVISSGAVPNPTSYTDGEYATSYLPGSFYTEYTMDGKPYNFSGKIKGEWNKHWSQTTNKILAGIECTINGNNGNGITYDITRPPINTLGTGLRPRAYNDLPALKNYAAFLEDKLKFPIQATALTLQAGIRLSAIDPGKLSALEPRLIASYELLNRRNNPLFDHLGINAGYGVAAKMPPLVYICPDKAYFDEASLNYLDTDYSLAVVTTHVIDDTSNPSLKPAFNYKKEAGIHFQVRQWDATITVYHERMKDCFDFVSLPYFSSYRKFSVEGSGKYPVYENGEVYYYENGEKIQASYTMDTSIQKYNAPANNYINIKKGMEYTITTGTINALRTSFVFDGAWMYDERYNTLPTYEKNISLYQGAAYPYIAIMPPGKKTIRQRFNTNIRAIVHIPEIRIVVSLTTQIVWIDKTRYRWEDENGVPYVYYYKDGVRINGDQSAYDDMEAIRYVDPIAFMDKQGVVHPWKEEYSLDSRYSPMVDTNNSSYYYTEDSYPPIVQFNIRLTKEFAQNLSVSFMANNFLKMNPYQKSKRSSLYVQRTNTPLYFGANLSFKF